MKPKKLTTASFVLSQIYLTEHYNNQFVFIINKNRAFEKEKTKYNKYKNIAVILWIAIILIVLNS